MCRCHFENAIYPMQLGKEVRDDHHSPPMTSPACDEVPEVDICPVVKALVRLIQEEKFRIADKSKSEV